MKASKEFVKPFAQMTEYDKMENMLGDMESRKLSLAKEIKELDDLILGKTTELEALTEERERWAQTSVSTIATADLIRREIERIKASEGEPPK